MYSYLVTVLRTSLVFLFRLVFRVKVFDYIRFSAPAWRVRAKQSAGNALVRILNPFGVTVENLLNPYVVMSVVGLMYLVKSALKIGIGSYINSPVLTGDGFHNLADLLEVGIVLLVVYVSRRPASDDYKFGKQNSEYFATLFIGFALLALALAFSLQSLVGILAFFPAIDLMVRGVLPLPAYKPLAINDSVTPLVLLVTFVSIVLSQLVSRYQIAAGRFSKQQSVIADGEETASDGRIEIVTFIGIFCEYFLRMAWLEYPIGLLVAGLVAHTGFELVVTSLRVLHQKSLAPEIEDAVGKNCLATHGVLSIESITTFQVGRQAVCWNTLVSRYSGAAALHIINAVKTQVTEFLVSGDSEFRSANVKVELIQPDPDIHRRAYALRIVNGEYELVSSLADAQTLLICDIEHDRIALGTPEEVPLEPFDLLQRKQVRDLYLYLPDSQIRCVADAYDISVIDCPVNSLVALDLEGMQAQSQPAPWSHSVQPVQD